LNLVQTAVMQLSVIAFERGDFRVVVDYNAIVILSMDLAIAVIQQQVVPWRCIGGAISWTDIANVYAILVFVYCRPIFSYIFLNKVSLASLYII